jgi:hypothetical protein
MDQVIEPSETLLERLFKISNVWNGERFVPPIPEGAVLNEDFDSDEAEFDRR